LGKGSLQTGKMNSFRRSFAAPVASLWLVIALGLIPSIALAQDKSELDTLFEQIDKLYYSGNYAEALQLAQRATQVAEKSFGVSHAKSIGATWIGTNACAPATS